jgi:ABC-type antimicrobial peptide transport system permease subunit
MIIELSVKYFVYNRKRTIKAIKLLSLGLIIISSSSILISSFTAEVNKLTYLLEEGNYSIIVTPLESDNFTIEQTLILQSYLDTNTQVLNYIDQYYSQGIINKQENESYVIPLRLIDMGDLISMYFPDTTVNSNTTIVSTLDIMNLMNLNNKDYYRFQFSNQTIYSPIYDFLDNELDFIHSGFYMDRSLLNQWRTNLIEIKLTYESNVVEEIVKLEDFDFVKVQHTRSEPEFLETSSNQIQLLLIILQSMISILVAMSIWNTFTLMLQESKYDIRVMLAVGYDKRQIRTMFYLISTIVGLLSSIISILIGFILVSIIFSLFSLITNTAFIVPVLTYGVFILISANGFLVALIASIYPIYKEVGI